MREILEIIEKSPGKFAFILAFLLFPFFAFSYALSGLIVSAFIYGFEVLDGHFRSKREDELYDKNVTALQNQIDQIKKDHATVMRTAEEAKTLISKQNAALSFVPKGLRT